MQPLAWYWRRFRSMPQGEVWWRVRSKFRENLDRCAAPMRRSLPERARIMHGNGTPMTSTRTLFPAMPNPHTDHVHQRPWAGELIRRADTIRQNRLNIFNLENHDLGDEVRWNFEYSAQRDAPLGFAPRIDYRDHAVTGDAKFVWEHNRHQHLATLGKAYRLTGDLRYAKKVVEHVDSWISQCPYGYGMNWRSPLELAIRLINWVAAHELIAPSGLLAGEYAERLLPVVYRHLTEITGKYSRYSSANNHLVGEAAGVFMACRFFPSFHRAAAWAQEARAILLREIDNQTHADGGNREQAIGYHLFVLEFFLLAGLAGRNTGDDFPEAYWSRLESMFDLVAALAAGGDALPMFGDADDGYVLNWGAYDSHARQLLAVGAALFNRPDMEATAAGCEEASWWLLGADRFAGRRRVAARDGAKAISADGQVIQSRAWPESGYYLLRSGRPNQADGLNVVFDCGPLGFGTLAAHGHADALSFVLRAFGEDILVDPGTYDYFTYPQWREYFRGTRAHNTIAVDDQDQSEMLGSFLWGRRAHARCLEWSPNVDGGAVVGEHDGYTRLPDPVTHRRGVKMSAGEPRITVVDELEGRQRHELAMYWHVSDQCGVRQVGPNAYRISCAGGELSLEMDVLLTSRLHHGCTDPIIGWVSRGYHRKNPSTTIEGRCGWQGGLVLVTRIGGVTDQL